MELPRTEIQEEISHRQTESGTLRRLSTQVKVLPRAIGMERLGRILSTLVFLSGCILLVHALAYISDTLAPDGNTRFLQTDRQHTNQIFRSAAVIDALALGNSHTGAINMAALGYENGYRFARADGDLFEVRYYLESFIPRMPEVDVVLIPISYFSFSTDNTASEEVEVRRAHMYASLPSWRFMPGDFDSLLIGKSHTYIPVMRLLRQDNWEAILYALLGRPPEEKGFIEVADDDCTYLSQETLSASVENRVAKYMRLTQEMSTKHPGLAQDTYDTAAAIQRYLQASGVRAIFFTPPYLKAYTETYQSQDPETIALMRSSMDRLQRELDVEYYDFSGDESFSNDPTQFKDSDHLNGCGAKRFSAKFRSSIPAQP